MLIPAMPPIKSLALARLRGTIAISTVAGFINLVLSPLVRGYLENRIAHSSAIGIFCHSLTHRYRTVNTLRLVFSPNARSVVCDGSGFLDSEIS